MLKRIPRFFTSSIILYPIALFILAVLPFVPVLLTPHRILSGAMTDTYNQFYYMYSYGFSHLRHGDLVLWNPYIYGGTPFFAAFQSTLLYPLNLTYLVLNTAQAINVSIVLHVFLIGVLTFLWVRPRVRHPLPAFLAGCMVMFSGAYFLHIFPGHLTNLNSMAWTPLLFLAIDRLLERRTLRWYLAGTLAVSLQLLGGHPQYVYYTALVAGIYAFLHLAAKRSLYDVFAALVPLYAGAVLITAVQLLPGLQAGRESLRTVLPALVTARFSFPPENLFTAIAPWFFGNMKSLPYWGRFYLWESCLFIGITGFALALHGAFYGDKTTRRFSLSMAGITLVLALGSNLPPLFSFLQRFLPFFNRFRGTSKFIFFTSLFLAMLAATGFDDLITRKRNAAKTGTALAVLCLLLVAGFGVFIVYPDFAQSEWRRLLEFIDVPAAATVPGQSTFRETYLPSSCYASRDFAATSLRNAADNVVVTIALLSILSAVFFFRTRLHRAAVYIVTAMALFELCAFACSSVVSFDERNLTAPALKTFASQHPGDYRVIFPFSPINPGVLAGVLQMDGVEALVQKRYAEFMAYTQTGGFSLREVNPRIKSIHPLFSLLRCRYVLKTDEYGTCTLAGEFTDVLPPFLLVPGWKLLPSREAIFREMENPGFSPRATVLLESAPFEGLTYSSATSVSGGVRVKESLPDRVDVDITLDSPAILLRTDSYDSGWKIIPRENVGQKRYRLLPADYILQGVPLDKGVHHLRFEYRPVSYVVGKWISIVSSGMFAMAAVGLLWRRSKRKSGSPAPQGRNSGTM